MAGMILGTAVYTGPEQARGKPVDRRADIWAFGCVLYEMLTGKQAFAAGETVSDAIAAILKNDPEWGIELDATARGRRCALHPDGVRFAVGPVPESVGGGAKASAILVSGFFEELRRLAPVPWADLIASPAVVAVTRGLRCR